MKAAGVDAVDVIGIGVDFTSCTMLPALADGTPLCLLSKFAKRPLAWPKLWKHHGAVTQTERINAVARERNEPLLERYGGIIGLEWFFPKVLETLENDPAVYDAAEVWLEAGDWFVWQLVGGDADRPAALDLPGRLQRNVDGRRRFSVDRFSAGGPSAAAATSSSERCRDDSSRRANRRATLSAAMAKKLGLRAGTPVSAAIIDAHAGVPGAGAAEPGVLVMVLGTSSCHMLNADRRPLRARRRRRREGRHPARLLRLRNRSGRRRRRLRLAAPHAESRKARFARQRSGRDRARCRRRPLRSTG